MHVMYCLLLGVCAYVVVLDLNIETITQIQTLQCVVIYLTTAHEALNVEHQLTVSK